MYTWQHKGPKDKPDSHQVPTSAAFIFIRIPSSCVRSSHTGQLRCDDCASPPSGHSGEEAKGPRDADVSMHDVRHTSSSGKRHGCWVLRPAVLPRRGSQKQHTRLQKGCLVLWKVFCPFWDRRRRQYFCQCTDHILAPSFDINSHDVYDVRGTATFREALFNASATKHFMNVRKLFCLGYLQPRSNVCTRRQLYSRIKAFLLDWGCVKVWECLVE